MYRHYVGKSIYDDDVEISQVSQLIKILRT